jgi:tRNA threonylcarbamoyladenosine biosynthesis protein TsaB
MKILAIDAATEACSAALLLDTEVAERYEVIGRGHADRLLPMADELLREAGLTARDLEAIAFGRGPGGFTGLRIAAGIAQGLAAGSGRPILPVSNLAAVAALAARVSQQTRVLVCMDARMGQVYWAAFDCRGAAPVALTGELLSNPAEVLPPSGERWFGAGHGFALASIFGPLADRLAGHDSSLLPRTSDIARIAAVDFAAGKGLTAARGLPVYLRDDVVHKR